MSMIIKLNDDTRLPLTVNILNIWFQANLELFLPSSSYEAATLRQSWHLFKDGTVVIVRYERSGADVLHVPVCWPYDS
jgi:hypothetical protein